MGRVPDEPRVLDTTVLSNFSYTGRVDLLASIDGICTVPLVRDELEDGIPVSSISERVADRAAVVRGHLDPGQSQALALADVHGGRLLIDDGDARTYAKNKGIPVVGSVGVLLAAVDAGQVDEVTADTWLKTWIDEVGFYVPYRDISEYRRL
jgi:predicted nucleic acid-binding protein